MQSLLGAVGKVGGMAPELELVSTSDCGVKMNSNPELTSEPVNSYCLEKLQSTDSYSCIYSLLNLDKVQLIYIYIACIVPAVDLIT